MVKSMTTAMPMRNNSATELKFHPLASLFPLLGSDELTTLSQDIIDNGLQFPITLHEGMILDGRNRYSACVMANVIPQFVEFDGDDPVKFVVSTNLHRRHLNESQRAMVAAKLANMPLGGATYRSANLPTETMISQAEAAQLLNTSERSLRHTKKTQDHAIMEPLGRLEL
jgi:hypothetical protein